MTVAAAHKYFTTPIFYANGEPHAGHIFVNCLMDILKVHYTHRGYETLTLTGKDEHGDAVVESAEKAGMTPQAYVDQGAREWYDIFKKQNLKFDIFMRTTSPEHIENVKYILNKCYEKGDIYLGEYDGHYCVRCEKYLAAREMDENKNCLVHKRPAEARKEKSWFFRVGKYRDQVRDLIEKGHVSRQKRYQNELLTMLDEIDGDLSISRPKSRLQWGISLPFDDSHVAYVWFDALPNYTTPVGGAQGAAKNPHWQNAVHLVGKDILKFHGIFWVAMCLSLEIPVAQVVTTGLLLRDGHKMSKSLGNGIPPEHLEKFGKDCFVNTVFRVVNVGEDPDISYKSMTDRYNADLANGIGNLVSRTLAMVEKYFDGVIPSLDTSLFDDNERALVSDGHALARKVEEAFDDVRLADAFAHIWELIGKADKQIALAKPWDLAKTMDTDPVSRLRLQNVLGLALCVIRQTALLAGAFFPEKMTEALQAIGESTAQNDRVGRAHEFLRLPVGHRIGEIPRLYLRMECPVPDAPVPAAPAVDKAPQKAPKAAASPKPSPDKPTPPPSSGVPEGCISIEAFGQVDLRVGTVIKAELVDGSDKLLRLEISLGDLGARTIFSGIRQWVRPEDIANRKVLVVANLPPRKMRFGTSEGMVLAAGTSDGLLSPIYLPEALKEGEKLS